MQTRLIIRGLPRSLAVDGWWLSSASEQHRNPPPQDGSGFGKSELGPNGRIWGLALLVLCADFLFWDRPLGLSLAAFSLVVFYVATLDQPPGSRKLSAGLIVFLGAVPVVEYLQDLSIAFLLASLVTGIVWVRVPPTDFFSTLASSAGFAVRLPGKSLEALSNPISLLLRRDTPQKSVTFQRGRVFFRNWAFPLGGALVFSSLLLDANPVLARIFSVQLDVMVIIERMLFWVGMAMLLWPLLDRKTPEPLVLPSTGTEKLPNFGINRASVLRALVLFNVVIGFQTGVDFSILVGGAELPAGMSYASYAHRGAYPLLATALLAGCFALAARPFLGENSLIRPLMYLWLGQNVLLCLSALFRLELYIDAYGLTYLRVYAVIWIALVAVGLTLIGWQAVRSRSNFWLVVRLGNMAVATLYVASFVNFADLIARKNVTLHNQDGYYLCGLGPMASATLARSNLNHQLDWMTACHMKGPVTEGWRDWSFRKWRVAHSLEQANDLE